MIPKHVFRFNGYNGNGGGLSLITEFRKNGDNKDIYWSQKIVLQSFSNSTSMNFCGGLFTPSILRKLADELKLAYKQQVIQLYQEEYAGWL